MRESIERWQIIIQGRVQGVGFRPFLARIAAQLAIVGEVRNQGSGVVIEAQGPADSLQAFVNHLTQGPPAARVDRVVHEPQPIKETAAFVIVDSNREGVGHTDPPLDQAPCEACLRELRDPSDRRHNYPFLNCTDCGPRFTVVEQMPFDRECTSMRGFPLCDRCRAEYADPRDRRYHAQVIACPDCGPRLSWQDGSGQIHESSSALAFARQQIHSGAILAIKGIGGYHLVCDATNEAVVARLRMQKRRIDKPFALMAASVEIISRYAEVSPDEKALLESPERPIVLLRGKNDPLFPIAYSVAPNLPTLGFLLPYTPLHPLLLDDRPLVMTSANFSSEPLIIDDKKAASLIGHLCDGVLSHNRPITIRCDDSVAECQNGATQLIRRSRGYVPDPILLPSEGPTVLAVGGELKSAPALMLGSRVYPGPHVGDLSSIESLEALSESVARMLPLFHTRPELVACDAHPGYVSRRWAEDFARDLGVPLVRVFHHEAHVAAWQLDTASTDQRAIVFCFDGTGYGRDGNIWGGECFLAEPEQIQRIGHLKPVFHRGDKWIERPYLMANEYLCATGITKIHNARNRQNDKDKYINYYDCTFPGQAVTPLTTSMGRFFDAVAALLGGCFAVSYEGQAAIELEARAEDTGDDYDSFDFVEEIPRVWDPTPVLQNMLDAQCDGVPESRLAGRFHRSIAQLLLQLSLWARDKYHTNIVGFTGGVFQNRLLTRLAKKALLQADFDVRLHRQLPCNDGGIAPGQAYLARQIAKQRMEMRCTNSVSHRQS